MCFFIYRKRETIYYYLGVWWDWMAGFFTASAVGSDASVGSGKGNNTGRILVGVKPDACFTNATSKNIEC